MIIYILSSFLILSIFANIMFVWYTRNLIKFLNLTNDDTRVILSDLIEYLEHLESVYNMDVFYGDTTLESLLKHTKVVTEDIEQYVTTTNQLIMEEEDEQIESV